MVAIDHDVLVQRGDIDKAWLDHARRVGAVGCDIETTGLDWRIDQVRTVQVAAGAAVAIVQVEPGMAPPRHLLALMVDASVTKVFHHAPFDLRFITATWGRGAKSVACTKVAAKIVEPGLASNSYSLKPTLRRLLGVSIDKSQQVSDWSLRDLTAAQLEYAANDVRYLVPLLASLRERAAERGMSHLLDASFAYLPVRAELDVLDVGDVFAY